MIDPDDGSNAFIIAVEEAISFGGLRRRRGSAVEHASQHVLVLLEDAAVTFATTTHPIAADAQLPASYRCAWVH